MNLFSERIIIHVECYTKCTTKQLQHWDYLPHLCILGKRRRSSLMPVLTRLASVGLLGSVSSSTDLTREAPSNDTSDEEEDSAVVDMSSRPNSNYSNFSSSDCLSLGRTISTASSVSAITYNNNISTENLVKDNPAFIADESPPDYKEATELQDEVSKITHLFTLNLI